MNSPAPDAPKLEWRTWATARRKARTRHSREEISSQIQAHLHGFLLEHSSLERSVQHVLSYRAFGSEVDLEPLVDSLPELKFYAPRANLVPGPHLTLHPWSAPTVRSKLGMLEPGPDALEVEPNVLECVLLPGLAFDRSGFRLGYGMGFYDRLLENLPSSVLLVGVCSRTLQVEKLPREPHDRAVGWLADEQGVHRLD
jgi:5-formyltetrahydrofolate cyclo-ligase